MLITTLIVVLISVLVGLIILNTECVRCDRHIHNKKDGILPFLRGYGYTIYNTKGSSYKGENRYLIIKMGTHKSSDLWGIDGALNPIIIWRILTKLRKMEDPDMVKAELENWEQYSQSLLTKKNKAENERERF